MKTLKIEAQDKLELNKKTKRNLGYSSLFQRLKEFNLKIYKEIIYYLRNKSIS